MTRNAKAYVFAGCTVLMWATVATAFKLTLQHTGVEQLLLVSSFTAVLAVGALSFLTEGAWRGWRARDILKSAYIGLLNPFLYYLVLFHAYDLLPAQQAQTLNYLWPIMLVLFSAVFLKQRLTLKAILALVMSFAGVALIATEGNILSLQFRSPFGVALALVSTLIWAGYWTLNIMETRDKTARLFLNFLFGTVYILGYMVVAKPGDALLPVTWQGIAGSVYVGLFEMGITFYTWMKALDYADSTARVSNLVYFAPFLSLLIIALVLQEAILPATLFGLVLIIAGIILQQYRSSQRKHQDSDVQNKTRIP